MDILEKPEYNIDQQVIYKYGTGKALGKILSAIQIDSDWIYIIHDPQNPRDMHIPSKDIISTI